MSEIVDKKRKGRKAQETVPVEKGPIETDPVETGPTKIDGFTPEETARLLKVKAEIENGRYTDITDEHRKLLFVQWLVEHGKLSS